MTYVGAHMSKTDVLRINISLATTMPTATFRGVMDILNNRGTNFKVVDSDRVKGVLS